jgi:hypothetical protein
MQDVVYRVNTVKVEVDKLLHLIMWRKQIAEEELFIMNSQSFLYGCLLQPLESFELFGGTP